MVKFDKIHFYIYGSGCKFNVTEYNVLFSNCMKHYSDEYLVAWNGFYLFFMLAY